LSVVGVSSMTGAGIPEFFEAVTEKAEEFERDYKPELERRKKQREEEKEKNRQRELGKLMKDMTVSGEASSKEKNSKAPTKVDTDMDTLSDMEDNSDGEIDDAREDPDDPEGLSARYKQALADKGGASATNDDHSFTRYLRTSQMNL